MLGLQTSAQLREVSRSDDHIDLFADHTKLIVDQDDRHLDFRILLSVQDVAKGGREIIATATVRCPNRVGQTYPAVVRPFHRLAITPD